MVYDVIWHEESLKDLKKFNQAIAKKIVVKIKNYLVQDPEKLGTPLKGNLKGFHLYRIGEYRIIYVIDQVVKKIIILNVNHSKKTYE